MGKTNQSNRQIKLKDKYPGLYFEHWLVMLSTMKIVCSREGFEEQVTNYLHFEGEAEMQQLKEEVLLIIESGRQGKLSL